MTLLFVSVCLHSALAIDCVPVRVSVFGAVATAIGDVQGRLLSNVTAVYPASSYVGYLGTAYNNHAAFLLFSIESSTSLSGDGAISASFNVSVNGLRPIAVDLQPSPPDTPLDGSVAVETFDWLSPALRSAANNSIAVNMSQTVVEGAAVAVCSFDFVVDFVAPLNSTSTGAFVGSSYEGSLGYQYDPTATSSGIIDSLPLATLHCNPAQQFNQQPPSGGTLLSFSAAFHPALTTASSGSIRFGLYAVSNSGSYSLLAGTNVISDSVASSGTSASGVSTSSTPLYYPGGGGSATVYPDVPYSLCFTTYGTGGGVIAQTLLARDLHLAHW